MGGRHFGEVRRLREGILEGEEIKRGHVGQVSRLRWVILEGEKIGCGNFGQVRRLRGGGIWKVRRLRGVILAK